ncbi:hypothetical protein OG897_23615 [Streptomyces sp. NBC_00237]|uniref:hypothetical protein n=1 Tax=Streptomyces sp. NBC_00237 TaxID=2975687 RepID=UPI00225A802D|nr:hypothetical protein [Streptomyces sp. NBC_00237]MCX5204429.1 hypothetical protein [Streptomyces sp. NBC_00237]
MGATGQPQSLVRGARFTGSGVCLLLALLTGLWIVRDLRLVDDPARLWWAWAGSGADRFLTASTRYELSLLLVYVVVAVVVPRSPVAASALTVTALVTLAVRAPALWAEGFAEVYPHGLRMRAMVSTFLALGLAATLLIVVAAGRRPVRSGQGAPGSYGRTDARSGTVPTRPGRVTGVVGGLLLAAVGLVAAAWEVHEYVRQSGSFSRYAERFTGSGGGLQLLGMPAGWACLVLVALSLTAAVGALLGAVHSRPLGLVVAGLVWTSGAAGVSLSVRANLFADFGTLDAIEQLTVSGWVFQLVAGTALVLILGRRGVPGDPPPRLAPNVYDGYGPTPLPGGGGFGPPPPSSRPPGW